MFSWLRSLAAGRARPSLVAHRRSSGRTAVVLVHGFSGAADLTWTEFAGYLLLEPSLSSWDVFSLGYASSLRVDIPSVWRAHPDLTMVARTLGTALESSEIRRYERLAIVAHSMGGLAIQKALILNPSVRRRVCNLSLYGTPSAGLVKAGMLARLKRQFRDMAEDGSFIRDLREEWSRIVEPNRTFSLLVVAGDQDEFVPGTSSFGPFPEAVRAAVPGNHVDIVRPRSGDDGSIRVLVNALTGGPRMPSVVDSSRLALELGNFNEVVEALLPNAANIDSTALVTLALALDATGRQDEALAVLERSTWSSTDAMGVLAGRLKRRWLISRQATDLNKAADLYRRALSESEAAESSEQALYHAINLAFLSTISCQFCPPVPADAQSFAMRALAHCKRAVLSQWSLATEGEAALILGDLTGAAEKYKQAIAKSHSPREIQSMYSQAVRLAERIFGTDGLKVIELTFGMTRS